MYIVWCLTSAPAACFVSPFRYAMDAQPWPGYAWHVLEHFAALARLQLLRLLQRWDLPQRAHVQLLQCYGENVGETNRR